MDLVSRTFLGVRVPPELYPSIDQALLTLKRKPGILDVRWNQTSEWVLNMVTLGELSVSTIAKVTEAARATLVDQPAFTVSLERFVGLPNMIQPRFAVIQLGGEGAQVAIDVAGRLETATRGLTPPRDGKPFQPNIVMGRLKTESEQLRVALGRALKMPDQPTIAQWQIDQIELFVSSAGSMGMSYKLIESFPLRT